MTKTQQKPPFRLLLSLDDFNVGNSERPATSSIVATTSLIVLFLVGTEQLGRFILNSYKDVHPVLESETSRMILARHLGVDVLSCLICSTLGWLGRHICADLFSSLFDRNNPNAKKPNKAAWDQRLYTFHAAGCRLSLYFFAYQWKNLYDTIVWNDGPEFIAHHILSIVASAAALDGCCTYYSIFYFGLSEVSTTVLCALANFDDVHGVPGLGDAMPVTKAIIAVVFVVMFILCRCVMWPIATKHFVSDTLVSLKMNDDRTKRYKHFLYFLMVACTFLTILQVAWLGQIGFVIKEELEKAGVL